VVLLPIATSFVDPQSFNALVAGFAAFASVTAFYSAFAAFISWSLGEAPADTADAAGVGLAYGCVVGLVVGALAYVDALTAHYPG
jgi:hypothetical protein